jgi:hypothetical protein
LEELLLDNVNGSKVDLRLDDICETLQELRSLKRFGWTNFKPVDITGILTGFEEIAEKMEV